MKTHSTPAENEGAAGVELDTLHALAVHFGAVGGAEVGEHPDAVFLDDLPVMAGDGLVGDDQHVVIRAAHGDEPGGQLDFAAFARRGGELYFCHRRAKI